MYQLNQIPIFKELEQASNILIAGAGFDIYSGIPLYLNLLNQGKQVFLANLSFTSFRNANSEQLHPFLRNVKSSDRITGDDYFPEKYLAEWFLTLDKKVDMWAFEKTGVKNLKRAYDWIIKKHQIDTIILVDGGTDSLMFGDESGLGTPEEDSCSLAAVFQTSVVRKYLVCLGFGIDHFHGVSHYHFLENVATLIKNEGFLGSFHLTSQMEEGKAFISAVNYANNRLKNYPSIVTNSVKSALEGEFGNHHKTDRTQGSELWINPLMSIYWCFQLDKVVQQMTYYNLIKNTVSMSELAGILSDYRGELKEKKERKDIPL